MEHYFSGSETGAVSKSLWARGLKRLFDLVSSAIGLIIVAPLLLLAIVIIKLTSPGPIFFMQVRTGRYGREFRPYKLRTMRAIHIHDPTEVIPLKHPGITSTGKILRRLKIDELPQIINVVKGEMSLIGPRPTLPEQTKVYDAFKQQRLLIRPGLTGLAQVNSSASISWDERIKYDVYYVKHHGFLMDLGILLKTVLVVLRGEEHYARLFEESPYGK